MDLGAVIYELTNTLLAAGWFVLAVALWRVRSKKPLKGGECPVVLTLLAYGITRLLILFDFKPWDMPQLMTAVSGLTIVSVVILWNVLNELRKQPTPKGDVIVLNGDIAKTYAEIKKRCGGPNDGC